jgi:TrmH family RNA methyltransferase
VLDNPRSSRVRAVAMLARKSARTDSGTFLLEGPQAVREALLWRPDLLVDVYATEQALTRHDDIAALTTKTGIAPQPVTERVLDAMADTVTPQGFVAVCRQLVVSSEEVFASAPRLVAVLEEVRDPGNAGTIIRAADAAGADAVVFVGNTVDVFNPKAVRSTTGSLFHLPVATARSLTEVIAQAHAAGMVAFAADMSGDALPALRASGDLARATAWVFGNEAHGVSADAVALVDRVVTVPIYGRAESMNLATAASVCLYESAFAQRA